MANYIGPITLSIPHVREGDEIKPDGSETINVVCSPIQAKQLLGLAENVVKNDYGPVRIIRGLNTRWGVMPIDTSENLKINEDNPHKGFYAIGPAEETFLNYNASLVKIPAEMVSRNLNEILSVLYSKGGEDGTSIESGFEDLAPVTIFEDDFTGAYTDNWTTFESYYMSGASVSTSGGKLVMTGTNTAGASYGGWGRVKTYSKQGYAPPWTLEFDLEYTSGTYCYMSLIMVQSVPQPWYLSNNLKTSNYIRFSLYHRNSKLYMLVYRCKAGATSTMIAKTELDIATESNPNFKVNYTATGYMEIYVDKTGGTSFGSEPVWKGNTGLAWTNPYFMYEMQQASGSSVTTKANNFKIYVEDEVSKPNIVVAPPDAVCNETPDFTRASEDGNIQCFQDITDPLNYQILPANFYKGSVKAMNGNYTDNLYRQVTFNDVDLDPSKFYVSNGLVKLETTLNGVKFYYWNGTAYVLLNTFTLPSNTSLIRPFHVTPWEFILQLDRTYWAVKVGKPFIWVKHPNTVLGYGLKTCYYHDASTTTDPVADSDISMETQFYCNIWDKGTGDCTTPSPSDDYRLMIIKKDPTTIKSDSIPASSMTGLGWYNGTLALDNVNGYLSLAREWHNQTKQALALQGI